MIYRNFTGRTPAFMRDRMLTVFRQHNIPLNEVTVVITGQCGPTGKTWLCNQLRHYGINAVELILDKRLPITVDYPIDGNNYAIDLEERSATVVLNCLRSWEFEKESEDERNKEKDS